jgi:peptidase inhibitor family I36
MKGAPVKGKTTAASVLFLIVLTVAAGAQALERGGSQQFRGVPVMPGGIVVGDRIVYNGGDVVVVPAGAGIDSFGSCPSGYLCLFQDVNWGGNMVQISNCCAWNNLANFGFNEMASSWRNRKNVDGQIAQGADGNGSRLCLNNNSYASSLPAGWDNTVSSFRVRDAATYC